MLKNTINADETAKGMKYSVRETMNLMGLFEMKEHEFVSTLKEQNLLTIDGEPIEELQEEITLVINAEQLPELRFSEKAIIRLAESVKEGKLFSMENVLEPEEIKKSLGILELINTPEATVLDLMECITGRKGDEV